MVVAKTGDALTFANCVCVLLSIQPKKSPWYFLMQLRLLYCNFPPLMNKWRFENNSHINSVIERSEVTPKQKDSRC